MPSATPPQVRALLAARAFLSDDPVAYMAGVEDALAYRPVARKRAAHHVAPTSSVLAVDDDVDPT